jgi:hypothetical protein
MGKGFFFFFGYNFIFRETLAIYLHPSHSVDAFHLR